MSHFLDAVCCLRAALPMANMIDPVTILLGSAVDGDRMMRDVLKATGGQYIECMPTPVEMADGSIYMEVMLLNVKVRWPANRLATPDGSWSYV